MDWASLCLALGVATAWLASAYRTASGARGVPKLLVEVTKFLFALFLAAMFLSLGVDEKWPIVSGVSAIIAVVAILLLSGIIACEFVVEKMNGGFVHRLRRRVPIVKNTWRHLLESGEDVDGRSLGRPARQPVWFVGLVLAGFFFLVLMTGMGLRSGQVSEMVRLVSAIWLVSMLVVLGMSALAAWAIVALTSGRFGAGRSIKTIADAAGYGLAVGVLLGLVAAFLGSVGFMESATSDTEFLGATVDGIFALSTSGAMVGVMFGLVRASGDFHLNYDQPGRGVLASVFLLPICVFFVSAFADVGAVAKSFVDDAVAGVPNGCSEAALSQRGVVAMLGCDGNAGFLYSASPNGAVLSVAVLGITLYLMARLLWGRADLERPSGVANEPLTSS